MARLQRTKHNATYALALGGLLQVRNIHRHLEDRAGELCGGAPYEKAPQLERIGGGFCVRTSVYGGAVTPDGEGAPLLFLPLGSPASPALDAGQFCRAFLFETHSDQGMRLRVSVNKKAPPEAGASGETGQ